jgi:hypothetical protein
MFDEAGLKEKLRAIEALFSGAATEGERDAAERARQRIMTRLREMVAERQVEWQFSLDRWSYDLLVALARRYGLEPYRYRRQRYSTLIVKASERFLKETFLPEYDAMSKTLHEHLTAVTKRVVAEVLNADKREATVVDAEARQLDAFAQVAFVKG